MEIRDYLRIIGRRFWIVLIVPAVAVALAVGMLSRAPDQFRARATVSLSGLGDGPQGAKQLVDEFRAAIQTVSVLDAVAEETEVPKSAFRSKIETTQVGTSSILGLRLATDAKYREQAPDVLRVAATRALALTLDSVVDVAAETVKTAEATRAGTQIELDALTQTTGVALPDELYSSTQNELLQMRVRYEEAAAGGLANEVVYYNKAIKSREDQLARLAPQVERYRSLRTSRDQAVAQLSTAREQFNQASARFNAATTSKAVVNVNSGTTETPQMPQLIRAAVAAGGGGLVLAVLAVLLLESALPGRRRRQPVVTAVPDRLAG